jgi:CelD/BcsL family acetyltransferase involved in cellulose biosynthesis
MQDDYQRQLAAMQQQISELYRALGMKAKAAAKTRKKEGA